VTALSVVVAGVPVPQGSVRSLGAGRPSVHSNAAVLMPWRQAVIACVQHEMEHCENEWPLLGPVKLAVSFTMPRPKSAPKWRLWPDKKPDLDKLVRAIGDALTQSGAIADDAQIVLLSADKQYGIPQMSLLLRQLEQPRRV
jgi:Holliday junction resolvase RusA-like endonuclease